MNNRIDPANTVRVMKPSGREAASRKALEAVKTIMGSADGGGRARARRELGFL
jgi:hypothetical protein